MCGMAGIALRQMQPIRMHVTGEARVAGDEENKLSLFHDALQLLGKHAARARVPMANDNCAALWQFGRRGDRIREANLVRHQDQRGQAAPTIEGAGKPC